MRINLTNARKEKDLTQRDLAAIIGITEQHYQRLEAGTSNGSTRLWEKLAQVLDKSIDYLLSQAA